MPPGAALAGRGESATGSHAPVIALPLENLSRAPGQEYFSNGLTEAMLTNLAKFYCSAV